MPFLCALYGSLQGTDGFFHFAVGSADWVPQHPKFSVYTPVTLGQFPAAALIYRKGYVRSGPVVVREAAKLADLYELRGTALSEPQNLDELRKANVPPGGVLTTARPGAVDPLAPYVGRVVRCVGEAPGRSTVRDLSPYVDRSAKRVRSATGELTWSYGAGLVRFDTPFAQGATGFLQKAGALKLSDVTVRSANEYGSVAVVSLDGEPLKRSRKILVQVMTEDANDGWRTSGADLKRIESIGGPPLVVRRLAGSVTLRRPDARSLRVTALDANGYRSKDLGGGRDGAVRVDLLEDCLYYVIAR